VARLCEIGVPGEVLARAREGDERARAQIYGALAPATFGLIRRLVGKYALAEDMFQDTMVTLYERLDSYRGEAPLGAWVRRIAVSRCLMHLRSPWHRARIAVEQIAGFEELRPVLPPAAESLDIERALASLAPTARAVVWLYEVEGYSHEEIARSFGRSVSFSKSQLARAHRRLRDWFELEPDRESCTPV
jgi:RNA polymerase sigma factor (sigma-70 family)